MTRLETLRSGYANIDRTDIVALETHAAHIDRIQSMPNWPVDTNLFMKLLGYTIIPPLAWVGAALVEGVVEQVTL